MYKILYIKLDYLTDFYEFFFADFENLGIQLENELKLMFTLELK